jgi:FkbM family methyltransferase
VADLYDFYPEIIRSSSEPVVVLEIGVGRAEDTDRMVDWIIGQRKQYRFFAFEPEQKNLPFIRDKVGKKVEVLDLAIGDKDGFADFTSSGSWPLSGSIKAPKNHLVSYPWIPWQPPVPVPMMRLDTFARLHSLPKIDFIWADVQGAEDLLIEGGKEALKRTRYFYTEFYNTEEYTGQIGLQEIHNRLPGKWEIVKTWPGDIAGSGNVLFKNSCPS